MWEIVQLHIRCVQAQFAPWCICQGHQAALETVAVFLFRWKWTNGVMNLLYTTAVSVRATRYA